MRSEAFYARYNKFAVNNSARRSFRRKKKWKNSIFTVTFLSPTRKLKGNMWWFWIIPCLCVRYDIIDSVEIYQSIMTFVVQRIRNLNYLCPFLVTETCIDNRWVCAIELRQTARSIRATIKKPTVWCFCAA